MSMIINPNATINAFYRIVFQVICTVLCNENKFSFMRKTINVILNAISSIVGRCARNAEICSYRDAQIVVSVCHICNLTLFPSTCIVG